MLIDLTEVLSSDGNERKFEVVPDISSFETVSGTYPVSASGPLELCLTNKGGKKLMVEGRVRMKTVIPCDRCLTNVETELPINFSIEVDMKSDDAKRTEALDETGFISGNEFDTDWLLREEMLLVWPVKTLCMEGCRGICRKCGRNLNLGDCGCDLSEPDPRMAAIADIFKNNV